MGQGSASLTNLATDWRKFLFPRSTDEAFADGYAQAVTFGLLMARARNITLAITLANGLDWVSEDLDRAMSGLQMSTTVTPGGCSPGQWPPSLIPSAGADVAGLFCGPP